MSRGVPEGEVLGWSVLTTRRPVSSDPQPVAQPMAGKYLSPAPADAVSELLLSKLLTAVKEGRREERH